MPRPFHLAMPVNSIENVKKFYIDILRCDQGRSDTTWIDLNFFGHQLVFHLVDYKIELFFNPVDSKSIPIPHFGVIVKKNIWENLINIFKKSNIDFIVEPYIRFENKNGEQGTFFVKDCNNLCLEFKYFNNDQDIFK